jgi:hypothetical protein
VHWQILSARTKTKFCTFTAASTETMTGSGTHPSLLLTKILENHKIFLRSAPAAGFFLHIGVVFNKRGTFYGFYGCFFQKAAYYFSHYTHMFLWMPSGTWFYDI